MVFTEWYTAIITVKLFLNSNFLCSKYKGLWPSSIINSFQKITSLLQQNGHQFKVSKCFLHRSYTITLCKLSMCSCPTKISCHFATIIMCVSSVCVCVCVRICVQARRQGGAVGADAPPS